MSARELVALGTASQVPTKYRNHNGYLLRWDNEGFLFDPGEGTQRQMIYAGVSSSQISRICITHFHGDHCLGLAGMSQRISLDRVAHEVHVYYPASGQVFYERLRHASIFHDVAKVVPHPIDSEGIIEETKEWTLSAYELDHGVDTYGYRLQEKDGIRMLPDRLKELGVTGLAIRELIQKGTVEVADKVVHLDDVSVHKKGQSFAFVMDTRMCSNAVKLAQDVDMLVCESTFLHRDADKAHSFGHLTAVQAANIAKAANARRLVLTHFSQRYLSNRDFVEEASPIHADVVAAKDGDIFSVPKRLVESVTEQ